MKNVAASVRKLFSKSLFSNSLLFVLINLMTYRGLVLRNSSPSPLSELTIKTDKVPQNPFLVNALVNGWEG